MSEHRGSDPGHPGRVPYRDPAVAAAYAMGRAGSGMDRREQEALGEVLDRAGLAAGARVLDCPAGGGRLAGFLAARRLSVVAADQSEAMLAHAAAALSGAGLPRRLAGADALSLPFRDGAFDLVLCHRLIHHLESEKERRDLLRSLAEATRTWVLLSWFDAASLQHIRRAMRRPFRPSRRHAVTRAVLLRDAAAAGLTPVASRSLRPWIGEVSFVLLRRGTLGR